MANHSSLVKQQAAEFCGTGCWVNHQFGLPGYGRTRVNIPGLGHLTKDEYTGWYCSEPLPLPLLNGRECRVIVEGYEEDDAPEQYHAAIANLLTSSFSTLQAAESYVFKYYQDIKDYWDPANEELVRIESPAEVWQHIDLDTEPVVTRRGYGDRGIYVSLELNCAWESEHGLQIVLKDGSTITKVGPYDGHLTNSDAYSDPKLEHVVYR